MDSDDEMMMTRKANDDSRSMVDVEMDDDGDYGDGDEEMVIRTRATKRGAPEFEMDDEVLEEMRRNEAAIVAEAQARARAEAQKRANRPIAPARAVAFVS